MPITVGNARFTSEGVYLGRFHPKFGQASPLANPFPMTATDTRDDVCEKYDNWIKGKIKEGDPLVVGALGDLIRLYKAQGHLTLLCWCAPHRCHCDTVKRIILKNLHLAK